MPDDFPSRSLDKIVIRVPNGMRDELRTRADRNNRSMNAEIVARLLDSLAAEDGVRVPEAGLDLLHRLRRDIEDISGRIAGVEQTLSINRSGK